MFVRRFGRSDHLCCFPTPESEGLVARKPFLRFRLPLGEECLLTTPLRYVMSVNIHDAKKTSTIRVDEGTATKLVPCKQELTYGVCWISNGGDDEQLNRVDAKQTGA